MKEWTAGRGAASNVKESSKNPAEFPAKKKNP